MEAVLGLRNIRQAFTTRGRQVLALDNVSLDVRRGEFLTIVGPSGCGKSTLLSLIVGLQAPSGGSIEYERRA